MLTVVFVGSGPLPPVAAVPAYTCICVLSGAYEPPKAARSVQLRRTAFAFTHI